MRSPLKPHVVAIGLIALLLVFVAAGAGFLFWKIYRDTETAARNKAASASQVVSVNVGWALETARQVLERVDNSFGDDLASPTNDSKAKLAEAVSTLPGSVKVYVVDAGGTTRLTTDPDFKPIDIRDREYFSAVAKGDSWHISSLLVSRLNGEQIFAISKRIERNGAFAGAAILSFNSDFMKEVWQSLNLGELSTVSLFRNDGQLVSRYPLPDGPMDLSRYVLFTDYLPASPAGVYDAVSPADGVSRIVGYRRVPGTPLVALASVSRSAAFASFNANTISWLTIIIPAAIALFAIAYWTFRVLREDARKRESEAQFRIFAEAMPNHVWSSQPDGSLDWFNSRVYEYSGAAPGELDGQGWAKIVHPEDFPIAAEKWASAVATGQPYETEFRLLHKDGVHRWHIARAVPIRGADGRVTRWVGTNTDIDDQKKVAQALLESEARLQLAIEAGQLAVWELDVTNRRITPSAALNRLYGFPPDARPSLDEYQARYAPGELERVTQLGAEAIARSENELEVEVRHLWPDGTERWLLIRAQSDPTGPGLGARAIGVVIDITERKRVEQALVESERRLRLSQNAAGIASLELDIASGLVIGSDRFWEIWGLSRRDSVHISVLEDIVIPEDRNILSNRETRERGTASPVVEYRIRRPSDGQLRWLSRHIEFVRDASGIPIKMFGVMQDITEQKEAQSRQQMLTHELEHRTKNILAMVSAIASQTLRDTDLPTAKISFNERLRALANAHHILAQTRWTEASMRKVVEAGIAALPLDRVTIEGPDLALDPKRGLSLALAMNELGTNAVKYGALSNAAGRVEITWSVLLGQPEADAVFVLTWRERGGPTVSPPTRRGFGSFLITRVLGADFDGAVEIDYRPEGLQVTLRAPPP
ncbi:MAG TPA: PAS domain-containing protein [Bauldia sp.]|nr:PAS domain-containing protein [Bauldia sp.]